jgi:hypothetical protein
MPGSPGLWREAAHRLGLLDELGDQRRHERGHGLAERRWVAMAYCSQQNMM